MVKVGVAGYGVIGQRLADGVALQKDMELVGVADLAPTLSIKALKEKGMPTTFTWWRERTRASLTSLASPLPEALRIYWGRLT